jgi:hypothetical protein
MKRLSKVNPYKRKGPSTKDVRDAQKLAKEVTPRLAELMVAKEDSTVRVENPG